jgi:hypothetical protein
VGNPYPGSRGDREDRAAAAPRARVTPPAFRKFACRVLIPPQKEEGGGIQNAGREAASGGRRLHPDGPIFRAFCGRFFAPPIKERHTICGNDGSEYPHRLWFLVDGRHHPLRILITRKGVI